MEIKSKVISIFSKRQPKIYLSIDDLPIYNWFKINETNDLNWLIVDQKQKYHANNEALKAAWDAIFFEYLDTFGVPKQLREICLLRADYFLAQCEYFETQDASFITQMEIAQAKLEKITGESKPDKINLMKIYVQRSLSFRIDEKVMPVREFYNNVKALEMENEAKKQANGRG